MVVINDEDFCALKSYIPKEVLDDMVIYEDVCVPFHFYKETYQETADMSQRIWDLFRLFCAEYEDQEYDIAHTLKDFREYLYKISKDGKDREITSYLYQIHVS